MSTDPSAPDPVATAGRFRAMGTDVEVLTLGGEASAGAVGARAAVAIERLEAMWSRFRPTSEVCRLNDAGGAPVLVSPETLTLIEHAIGASRSTAGRYDPTILRALEAAGYDRDFAVMDHDGGEPSEVEPPVPAGCDGIDIDRLVGAVRLPAGVTIDLGGIGKGYTADVVAAELLAVGFPGVRGVLVNMGGDLRVRGDVPQPSGWVVAVDDPLGTGRTGVLSLATGAIATSTRLRRQWQRGGRPLHHLIDPRTGAPAQSGLASVTVIAGEAWRAEVLAKAAFVAGIADGPGVVLAAGATGLLVTDDGDVVELDGLDAFRP